MNIEIYLRDNGTSEMSGITDACETIQLALMKKTPSVKRETLVLPEHNFTFIDRLIEEYKQRETLKMHRSRHMRKVVLSGLSGTGKTSLADVVAGELNLPLFIIEGKIIESYAGETCVAEMVSLRKLTEQNKGVFLFEDFNLKMLAYITKTYKSDNILIATVRHDCSGVGLIEEGYPFDGGTHLETPDEEDIKNIITRLLSDYIKFDTPALKKWLDDFSRGAREHRRTPMSLVMSCEKAIKTAILNNYPTINLKDL